MGDYRAKDLTRLCSGEYAEALHALGRFNLAIFGKTGTGKSALVDAVLAEDVAATGVDGP